MDLLIWGGPVYGPGQAPPGFDDVGKVAWQRPTEVLTVNTGTNGGYSSAAFAGLAASLGASGSILDQLIARTGKTRADYDKVAIAGFSAFHGLAAPLLAMDGSRIDACVLLDACFSAVNPPWRKTGYVTFGALAASGDKLMVYTASHGGGKTAPYPSSTGSECAIENFEAGAALGSGKETFAPGTFPDGADVSRSGDLFLLDYGGKYMHGEHINKIGLDVLNAFLPGYLSGAGRKTGIATAGGWEWLGLAVLVAAGAVGGKLLVDKLSPKR